MSTASDQNSAPLIGRTKTVIVYDEKDNAVGIVSEIVARISSDNWAERLVFRGPVYFADRTLQHLYSIILPVVDRITEYLDVPRKKYEVSVTNLGASASAGKGIEISGFSADLPFLLTLLSSALQVGLRQDIVSTGHVASLDGDLAPVRGISVKLDAILASPGVTTFVLPELERDRSLELLTPFEYEAAKESILRHKRDIRIESIADVHDAVRAFTTDESIVLGSLKTGFFSSKAAFLVPNGSVGRTVKLLAEGNENRFWDFLECLLLNRRGKEARSLLQTYLDYHLRCERYPENFGEQLFRMVISLPPATRKLDGLFPLVSMELCIKLSQHAKQGDYDDVRQLHKAAFGEGLSVLASFEETFKAVSPLRDSPEKDMVDRFLLELSKENLARKFGWRLDEARRSYTGGTVIVRNGFEFNEAITAFHAHMLRHTSSPEGRVNQDALTAKAIDLVEKAFEGKGGYNGALSEGMFGTNGGMRRVYDMMTDYRKEKEKGDYIFALFNVLMDSRDENAKVRLMKAFMERVGPMLPAELRDLPTDQLARSWKKILICYIESIDKVSDLLKRL